MIIEVENLKKELETSMVDFTQMMGDLGKIETNYDNSVASYELRINKTLDIQYKASYIMSLTYRIINIVRPSIKKYKAGSKEYMGVKAMLDELNFHLDHFKNHVYTFSQRAKTLGILLSTKQMANPDVVRF